MKINPYIFRGYDVRGEIGKDLNRKKFIGKDLLIKSGSSSLFLKIVKIL